LQSLSDWAGPAVAIAAVFAVHRLTQIRDKEKAVFDLHKAIGESTGSIKSVIMTAWEDESSEKRVAAIQQAKWRLQQIGGLVERLRRMSLRRRLRLAIFFCPITMIKLTEEMGVLRDQITVDPFDDPTRGPVQGKSEDVEQAIGSFLQSLDEALLCWMD